MKTIHERVLNAIKEAGLLHKDQDEDSVIEGGTIFTSAQSNMQIIDALKKADLLDEVSTIGERFSGFSNGILFSINPF